LRIPFEIPGGLDLDIDEQQTFRIFGINDAPKDIIIALGQVIEVCHIIADSAETSRSMVGGSHLIAQSGWRKAGREMREFTRGTTALPRVNDCIYLPFKSVAVHNAGNTGMGSNVFMHVINLLSK
jgi:hypothetical protein